MIITTAGLRTDAAALLLSVRTKPGLYACADIHAPTALRMSRVRQMQGLLHQDDAF